jgi:hypothetical protein
LPLLLWFSSTISIPLSLTFIVQSVLAQRNLVPETLPKALLANYFLPLGISFVFWSMLGKKSVENIMKSDDDPWLLPLQLASGLLWYNLLDVLRPNFLAFVPRWSGVRIILVFLFFTLATLFSTIKVVLGGSGKRKIEPAALNIKYLAIFNTLYAVILSLSIVVNDTIPVVAPWIFLGLRCGIKLAPREKGAVIKLGLVVGEILNDIFKIFLGAVIASIFINIVT